MQDANDAAFYRKREQQELASSEKANDPMIKRLHWEMAQRYAYLAAEADPATLPTTVAAIRPTLHLQ